MRKTIITKFIACFIILTFGLTSVQSPAYAQSQGFVLPPVGSMLNLTQITEPVILKGLKVNPDNPFQFDFLVDPGQSDASGDSLKAESTRLIKYFLASLTIPEEEMWVNLSPYEKQRIIPTAFGETEMGRELLAQDYLLKQITSSLIYPEDELGAKFWEKIYAQTGVEDIPVNIFNKVWIIPEEAVVYEGDGVAYVVESKLKVLLEEDYVALEENSIEGQVENLGPSAEVLRKVIIPVLENEVNTGEHFAPLRQIYHSLILASWYKRKLKNSVLTQVYADQKKTEGVVHGERDAAQKIYDQYIESFKVGVYDFIKDEYDPVTQSIIPRKYFSGGFGFNNVAAAMTTTRSSRWLGTVRRGMLMVSALFLTPDLNSGEMDMIKKKYVEEAAIESSILPVSDDGVNDSAMSTPPSAIKELHLGSSENVARFKLNYEWLAQLTPRELKLMTTREFFNSLLINREGRKLRMMDLASSPEGIENLFVLSAENPLILDPNDFDYGYALNLNALWNVDFSEFVSGTTKNGLVHPKSTIIDRKEEFQAKDDSSFPLRVMKDYAHRLKFDVFTINAPPGVDDPKFTKAAQSDYTFAEAGAFGAKGSVIMLRLFHRHLVGAERFERIQRVLKEQGFSLLGILPDASPRDYPDTDWIKGNIESGATMNDRTMFLFVKDELPEGFKPIGPSSPAMSGDKVKKKSKKGEWKRRAWITALVLAVLGIATVGTGVFMLGGPEGIKRLYKKYKMYQRYYNVGSLEEEGVTFDDLKKMARGVLTLKKVERKNDPEHPPLPNVRHVYKDADLYGELLDVLLPLVDKHLKATEEAYESEGEEGEEYQRVGRDLLGLIKIAEAAQDNTLDIGRVRTMAEGLTLSDEDKTAVVDAILDLRGIYIMGDYDPDKPTIVVTDGFSGEGSSEHESYLSYLYSGDKHSYNIFVNYYDSWAEIDPAAENLAKLLETEPFGKKFVLAGQSTGTNVIRLMAQRNPQIDLSEVLLIEIVPPLEGTSLAEIGRRIPGTAKKHRVDQVVATHDPKGSMVREVWGDDKGLIGRFDDHMALYYEADQLQPAVYSSSDFKRQWKESFDFGNFFIFPENEDWKHETFTWEEPVSHLILWKLASFEDGEIELGKVISHIDLGDDWDSIVSMSEGEIALIKYLYKKKTGQDLTDEEVTEGDEWKTIKLNKNDFDVDEAREYFNLKARPNPAMTTTPQQAADAAMVMRNVVMVLALLGSLFLLPLLGPNEGSAKKERVVKKSKSNRGPASKSVSRDASAEKLTKNLKRMTLSEKEEFSSHTPEDNLFRLVMSDFKNGLNNYDIENLENLDEDQLRLIVQRLISSWKNNIIANRLGSGVEVDQMFNAITKDEDLMKFSSIAPFVEEKTFEQDLEDRLVNLLKNTGVEQLTQGFTLAEEVILPDENGNYGAVELEAAFVLAGMMPMYDLQGKPRNVQEEMWHFQEYLAQNDLEQSLWSDENFNAVDYMHLFDRLTSGIDTVMILETDTFSGQEDPNAGREQHWAELREDFQQFRLELAQANPAMTNGEEEAHRFRQENARDDLVAVEKAVGTLERGQLEELLESIHPSNLTGEDQRGIFLPDYLMDQLPGHIKTYRIPYISRGLGLKRFVQERLENIKEDESGGIVKEKPKGVEIELIQRVMLNQQGILHRRSVYELSLMDGARVIIDAEIEQVFIENIVLQESEQSFDMVDFIPGQTRVNDLNIQTSGGVINLFQYLLQGGYFADRKLLKENIGVATDFVVVQPVKGEREASKILYPKRGASIGLGDYRWSLPEEYEGEVLEGQLKRRTKRLERAKIESVVPLSIRAGLSDSDVGEPETVVDRMPSPAEKLMAIGAVIDTDQHRFDLNHEELVSVAIAAVRNTKNNGINQYVVYQMVDDNTYRKTTFTIDQSVIIDLLLHHAHIVLRMDGLDADERAPHKIDLMEWGEKIVDYPERYLTREVQYLDVSLLQNNPAMLAKQYQLGLMKTMNDWADQLIAREKPPLDKKIEKLAWEFLDGLQTIMIGDSRELKKFNPIKLRQRRLRYQHALELLREQYAHKSAQTIAKSQSTNPIRENLYIIAADYAPQYMESSEESNDPNRREFTIQATGAALGVATEGIRKGVAQISTAGLDLLDSVTTKKRRGFLISAIVKDTSFKVSNEGGHGKNVFGNFIHVTGKNDDEVLSLLKMLGNEHGFITANPSEVRALVAKHNKELLTRYKPFFDSTSSEKLDSIASYSLEESKTVKLEYLQSPAWDIRSKAFEHRKESFFRDESGSQSIQTPFEDDLRQWMELREQKLHSFTQYLQSLDKDAIRQLKEDMQPQPGQRSRFSVEEKAAELREEIAARQNLLDAFDAEEPLLPKAQVLREEIAQLQKSLEPLEEIIRLKQETQNFLERPLGEDGPSVGEIATGVAIAGGVIANGQARREKGKAPVVVTTELDEKAAAMTAAEGDAAMKVTRMAEASLERGIFNLLRGFDVEDNDYKKALNKYLKKKDQGKIDDDNLSLPIVISLMKKVRIRQILALLIAITTIQLAAFVLTTTMPSFGGKDDLSLAFENAFFLGGVINFFLAVFWVPRIFNNKKKLTKKFGYQALFVLLKNRGFAENIVVHENEIMTKNELVAKMRDEGGALPGDAAVGAGEGEAGAGMSRKEFQLQLFDLLYKRHNMARLLVRSIQRETQGKPKPDVAYDYELNKINKELNDLLRTYLSQFSAEERSALIEKVKNNIVAGAILQEYYNEDLEDSWLDDPDLRKKIEQEEVREEFLREELNYIGDYYDRLTDSSSDDQGKPSAAMTTPGGIDLNPANWTLKMKGARGGDCVDERYDDCLHFNLPPEQIEQMRLQIDGLVPVILNIQPVPSLPIFLGLKDDEIPLDDTFPTELDPIRQEHAKLEEVS